MDDKDLRNIIGEIENLPFLRCLELKVIRWETGKCQLFVPAANKVLNNEGEIKLGLCSIVCEACAYIAVCTQLERERLPVVYSTQITRISSFPHGGIYVYSDSVGPEDNPLIVSKVVDEFGNLIALSTNRYFISS